MRRLTTAALLLARGPTPILLLSIIGLACSTSPTSPATSPTTSPATSSSNGIVVIGIYDAVTLNGSPLPVLLPTVQGCAMTGLAGAIALTAAGRFTATYSYRRQCQRFPAENIARAIGGRYTLNGSSLVFAADSGFSKFATAPLVTGTVSGATITAQATPTIGVTVTTTLRRR